MKRSPSILSVTSAVGEADTNSTGPVKMSSTTTFTGAGLTLLQTVMAYVISSQGFEVFLSPVLETAMPPYASS